MKQYKMILVALLGLILTACYNDFEEPKKPLVYNDEIFEALNPDLTHISIADLKALFGAISNTGVNDSANDTKHIHFVANPQAECSPHDLSKGWYRTENYYIKGKVISNDEQGNIYKSLYIFDGTAGIELKLTNGLYLDYPCNLETGETTWVYVKLRGLYLGNFRMMLSIGDVPTMSYNAYGNIKCYANSNILNPNKVREHEFLGEKDVLTESATDPSADIFVVDKNSYTKIHGSNTEKYLGRLIRFKGLRVHYAGVAYPKADGSVVTPTALKNGQFDQIYPSWLCTSGVQETFPPVPGGTAKPALSKAWYHLAYSSNNVALYGSVCLTYKANPQYTSEHGVYMLRTSGYSRFSNTYAPQNGEVGDVLAIYQIYSEKSNYAGTSSDWATYQLAVSRIEDIGIKGEPSEAYPAWSAHIKWAEDNFPQYVYPAPGVYVPTAAERNANVTAWKEFYNANKPADDGTDLWKEWNAWGNWVMWVLENTPEESYLIPQQVVEETDSAE